MKRKPKLLCMTAVTLALIGITQSGSSMGDPAITVAAMGGTHFSMWADGLLPLYEQRKQLFYVDGQIEGASNESGILSFGLGYRKQTDANTIYGAYLFNDRDRSTNDEFYDVISPGVERLSPTWRFRMNAYFPINDDNNLIHQGWASDSRNYSYINFSGHQEFDRVEYQYESLSYGGDITVGYRFENDDRWQVDVSPYAFDQENNNTLMGGNIQLSYYNSDYSTIFIGDGYDNANHNRVYIGVSLNLGSRNVSTSMENLMHAPVYRNLNVNTTSRGLPVSEYTEYDNQNSLKADDVFFINNAATISNGDGSYENPYSDITLVKSTTNTNADFRVLNTGIDYDSSAAIDLIGNQSISGYSNDYKVLSTGNNRPTVAAPGLYIEGNNTVDSIIIENNDASAGVGIDVASSATATINNVKVGSTNSETSFQYGVTLEERSSATIANSTITGYTNHQNDIGEFTYGVNALGDSSLTITNSTINSIGENIFGSAFAVFGDSGSTIKIDNSTLKGSGVNYGIGFSTHGGSATITNSKLIAYGDPDFYFGSAGVGVDMETEGDVTIINSTIDAEGSAAAVGVYDLGSRGSLSLTGNTINVDTAGEGYGVYYNAPGAAYVSGNTISVTGNSAVGIFDPNGTVMGENNLVSPE